MDVNWTDYIPSAVYLVLALITIRYLLKYRYGGWIEEQRRDVSRGADDAAYRQRELAKIEAGLAANPAAVPLAPVTQKQESRLRAVPVVILVLALTGMAVVYLGLFHRGQTLPILGNIPGGNEGKVFFVLGEIMLLLAVPFYLLTEKLKKGVLRPRLLTRKYILQKAGGDAALFDTLREIMAYYPDRADLWLEMADRHAAAGRLDDAVKSVRHGAEMAPGVVDYHIGEVSYQLRSGKLKEARKSIVKAEEMKRGRGDPRVDLYAGAVALASGDKEKALSQSVTALKINRIQTLHYLKRDSVLEELKKLLAENKKIKA